jgi:hypothetical protein
MAEAIVPFSLAANVAQFIYFSALVTSTVWTFFKTASKTSMTTFPTLRFLNYDLQIVLK